MKTSHLRNIIKEEIGKALKQSIYDDGYNYFETTGSINDNPYDKKTEKDKYLSWEKGFKDARKKSGYQ